MQDQLADIYTEPRDVDVRTLSNLGPLRPLAGIWQGMRGLDVKPKAAGAKQQAYVEHVELQPIDPFTNGPQLLYGLRYHSHITKPAQVKTYHDQIGYWLWEAAGGTVIADPWPERAVSPHRSQSADQDRRSDTQSPGARAAWLICGYAPASNSLTGDLN